jgi:hypothetical protein
MLIPRIKGAGESLGVNSHTLFLVIDPDQAAIPVYLHILAQ